MMTSPDCGDHRDRGFTFGRCCERNNDFIGKKQARGKGRELAMDDAARAVDCAVV